MEKAVFTTVEVLLSSCKPVYVKETPYNADLTDLRGALKHIQACLSASKDGESSFHYCRSPVKLVQACLWAGNTLQRHSNRLGCAVKHVEDCLSAS